MITKYLKLLLVKISRVIFWITPEEFKIKKKKELSPIVKILYDKQVKSSYETFEKYFEKSLIFEDEWSTRGYAIDTALLNDSKSQNFYLEFGTYKGGTANFFSQYVNKLYTFDSFTGLKEDWTGFHHAKGFFNLNKKIPKLNNNVEPIIGYVQDTFEDFLKKHNPKINFAHMDLDTYDSTKYILERIKPYLLDGSILIFDELYNYINWQIGEYKALKEVFNDNEYDFKSFNLSGSQVVIQIKK